MFWVQRSIPANVQLQAACWLRVFDLSDAAAGVSAFYKQPVDQLGADELWVLCGCHFKLSLAESWH
jgi:hypothetical protein